MDPDFGTDTILSFCTDSSIVRPQEGEDGVWIFPNPNHGSFRLRVNGDPGSYRLGIYDMRGRRVLFRKFRMKKSYMDRRVQLPSVRSGGIYLLRLKGAFGQEVKKLFIDR